MPEIIISDTSCLILLKKIGQLQLLPKLSSQIFVTSLIVKEFGSNLPAEIVVRDAPHEISTYFAHAKQENLEIPCDLGKNQN